MSVGFKEVEAGFPLPGGDVLTKEGAEQVNLRRQLVAKGQRERLSRKFARNRRAFVPKTRRFAKLLRRLREAEEEIYGGT